MWTPIKVLKVARSELNLDVVLRCGQTFRWVMHDAGVWISTVDGKLFKLRQNDDGIQYQVWDGDSSSSSHQNQDKQAETTLRNYFQLDVCLANLMETWKNDPFFEGRNCPGLRTLRQDPFECLMSFIMSSCNNVQRITQMVQRMSLFGRLVATVDKRDYHAFPTLDELEKVDELEAVLRRSAFGYRAAYIAKTVTQLREYGGEQWLKDLRQASYDDARQQLMKFPGIGRKVADCVCLMSLDKPEAVPVDTHIFQIAKARLDIKTKTCTPAVYPIIVDWFVKRFGPWAGWAQGVMFASTLIKETPNTKDERNVKKNNQDTKKEKSIPNSGNSKVEAKRMTRTTRRALKKDTKQMNNSSGNEMGEICSDMKKETIETDISIRHNMETEIYDCFKQKGPFDGLIEQEKTKTDIYTKSGRAERDNPIKQKETEADEFINDSSRTQASKTTSFVKHEDSEICFSEKAAERKAQPQNITNNRVKREKNPEPTVQAEQNDAGNKRKKVKKDSESIDNKKKRNKK